MDEKQVDKDNLLCNADNEGSTLLHLAVDSGIPQVSACAALVYCVMATWFIFLTMPITCPNSLLNLKLLVNDKITALCQTSMSHKPYIQRYRQQK